MTGRLASWDYDLMSCEGSLVAYDPDSATPCKVPCPMCCDGVTDIDTWNINSVITDGLSFVDIPTGNVVRIIPAATIFCGGGANDLDVDVYLCICVPTGQTLTITLGDTGLYPSYVPWKGSGAFKWQVYVDGGLCCELVGDNDPDGYNVCLWEDKSATVSCDVSTPGLHCIRLHGENGGDDYGINGQCCFIFECTT